MPFDSPDRNLGKMLDEVYWVLELPTSNDRGNGHRPDQQLVVSISLGHPIGVVMMLEVEGMRSF